METELNRREFVRLALMSSALLMNSGQLLDGEDADSHSVAYSGALRALPPGAVRPEGWLRGYLEKQASQLGSKLPQVSLPFSEAYWAEEQEGESWAPWEQKGYWIDGAARLALVLQDEELLAQAKMPTRCPQDGIGVVRGPLVYSLPIEEKWTTKVEPKYTTPEFPSWEAMPASEWNYGLALDSANLESQVEVKVRSVAPDQLLDPWENPPITIAVPARKIEDWELQVNPNNTAQKFTPCLPDLSISKISKTVERVSLVPYGSTQLRVTIFPALHA